MGFWTQNTGTFRIRSRTVPPPTPVMTASHMNPITSSRFREATSEPDTANTTAARTSKKCTSLCPSIATSLDTLTVVSGRRALAPAALRGVPQCHGAEGDRQQATRHHGDEYAVPPPLVRDPADAAAGDRGS